MSYLETSTHFNNWIFTEEELKKVARLRHLKVKKSLRLEQEALTNPSKKNSSNHNGWKRQARSFAALIPSSSTATKDVFDWNDEVNYEDNETIEKEEQEEEKKSLQMEPLLPFLNQEEEQVLCDFYLKKVLESCSQLFRTSDKVKSCAAMLYKRFYLSNSIMEFHPKYIVPTVIYVAGKIEEQYISVDTIAEQLQVDHKFVIGHEMILLEGVRFHLIMYHPFRALFGLLDDLRAFSKAKGKEFPLDLLQKIHANTVVLINDLLLTSLPLCHTPAHLALAALFMTVNQLEEEKEVSSLNRQAIEEYIKGSKFSKGQDIPSLFKRLSKIEQVYETQQQKESKAAPEALEKEAKMVKHIYKKLKKFHQEEEKESKNNGDKKRKSSKKESKKAKKQKKESKKE